MEDWVICQNLFLLLSITFFFSPVYVLSLFNSYKSTNSPVCKDSMTSLACFCSALFLFWCALTPLYLPKVRDGLFTNHCLVLKCHLFWILTSSWVGHKMNLVRLWSRISNKNLWMKSSSGRRQRSNRSY